MTIIKETRDEQGRLHSFNDEPAIEYSNGGKHWYCHGSLHRENDPAVICSNGDKYWYRHGERHRDNGHAIEYRSGVKYWYRHGERHRGDGPAIIRSDGTKEWWYEGTEYTLHEWLKLSSLPDEEKTELLLSHD